MERYTGLVQQIREKSKECKALIAEKKELPVYRVKRHKTLTVRIAELTEDLEELCSEKALLLQKFEYAEDAGAEAFRKDTAIMESGLKRLALGKEKLLQMLDEEPALAEYRFYIENMVRLSDHVLSADKEAVFAQSHLATGTAAAAFRALVSADMQFPEITDGQGNKANVSEGCYLLNMTSPDRVLRKNSFTGLMNTYHQYRNTLAATLTGSARTGYFYATVHNYKDTLEAALAEDNIPSSLYDGLIDTVHDNFAPLHEYIQFKKDVLGVDEFHYYDMYMPISTAPASPLKIALAKAVAAL